MTNYSDILNGLTGLGTTNADLSVLAGATASGLAAVEGKVDTVDTVVDGIATSVSALGGGAVLPVFPIARTSNQANITIDNSYDSSTTAFFTTFDDNYDSMLYNSVAVSDYTGGVWNTLLDLSTPSILYGFLGPATYGTSVNGFRITIDGVIVCQDTWNSNAGYRIFGGYIWNPTGAGKIDVRTRVNSPIFGIPARGSLKVEYYVGGTPQPSTAFKESRVVFSYCGDTV